MATTEVKLKLKKEGDIQEPILTYVKNYYTPDTADDQFINLEANFNGDEIEITKELERGSTYGLAYYIRGRNGAKLTIEVEGLAWPVKFTVKISNHHVSNVIMIPVT